MARPEQQAGTAGDRFPGHQIVQSDARRFLAGLGGNASFAGIFDFLGHAV
jgi:hypothetical protein